MEEGPKKAQMFQHSDPDKRQPSLTQPEPKVNRCGISHIRRHLNCVICLVALHHQPCHRGIVNELNELACHEMWKRAGHK